MLYACVVVVSAVAVYFLYTYIYDVYVFENIYMYVCMYLFAGRVFMRVQKCQVQFNNIKWEVKKKATTQLQEL